MQHQQARGTGRGARPRGRLTGYRGVLVNPVSLARTELLSSGMVVVDGGGRVVRTVDLSGPDAEEQLAGVDRVVDRRGCLIMPGFVDGHAHAPQYAFTGTGMDLPLLEWLETYTFPCEARFEDAAFARAVFRKSVRRHLRHGTTTVSYFGTLQLEANKALVEAVRDAGQRALVGKVSMDRNSPEYYVEDTAQGLADAEAFVAWVKGAGGADASSDSLDLTSDESESDEEAQARASLVTPVVTPRFVPSCTPEMLRGLGDIAGRHGVPVQSHLGESLAEIEWVRSLHPESDSYTAVYDDHGLLPAGERCLPCAEDPNPTPSSNAEDPNPSARPSAGDPRAGSTAAAPRPPVAYMAHCCHCDAGERALLGASGTGVVHCPSSNFMLGSGILPVRRLLREGVKVGLGTDVAGGYSASMLDAMRQAILASKTVAAAEQGKLETFVTGATPVEQEPSAPLAVHEAFFLATLGGAACVGMEDRIGSFAPGKCFDALIVDPNADASPFDTFPQDSLEDIFSKFIFLGDDRNIVEVYVDGDRVVG